MSASEQINFLLACIKHTATGGKIDFTAVAEELKIPTKAAAAKRYERLKKRAMSADLSVSAGNGDADGDANGRDGTASPAATTPKRAPATPRGKGKANGTTTAATPSKTSRMPGSAKRKRTAATSASPAVATAVVVSTSSPSDADDDADADGDDDAGGDAAGIKGIVDYDNSRRFVAVNTARPRREKAQKAAAAIKLEAELEAGEQAADRAVFETKMKQEMRQEEQDELGMADKEQGGINVTIVVQPAMKYEDAVDTEDDGI